MNDELVDVDTARTAEAFMRRINDRYAVSQAILFGSRARHTHSPDSDADIAVVLRGDHGKRSTVAMDMAGIAFEVLLDTGLLVEALPLWEDELAHPEHFSNPALIENIRKEGIRL
ncbi:nucleotidyltransferase family protein [Candidatus Methylospira mobilis]|nr:nucleotidyltransferase domain-containing protein [Candidatus Methylospira mobilis]